MYRVLLASVACWSGGYAVAEPVDFAREILPILSDKCFACHGPDTSKKQDLRLDSREAATADRDGVRAIDPARLADSELIARIFDTEDPMPPADAEQHLSDAERELLKKWVLQGGEYAAHWAFVPPVKAAVPQGGPTHPVDAFVARRLKKEQVDFAPEADRRTLARRVALTLTGLPPHPNQVQAFVDDKKPDAYARWVNMMLSRKTYGEHQARFWLDAIRYGDTHGLHLDNKRGIYPYRDWVVRAFNNNLPLDEFIRWQIAGDLMPDPTLEQQVATGYVRMNPSTAEGGAIKAEFQAKNNFDRTENLGTVLLGMTLNCARCHTHKYDPILQTEYYGLFAFFNSTSESPMDGNKYTYAPVLNVPADQAAWDQWEALERAVRKAPADSEAAKQLAAKKAELEKGFTTTLVAKELPTRRETKLLLRGEYDRPSGEPIEPHVPEVMGSLPEGAPANRLGLAQWLTAREHPLVARVLVNRLWQRVFGEGLVRTPEDFGLQGQQPTHPELLDWLAVELQESGWDMKHMMRLMVSSRTFRQASVWREDVNDPENLLLARGPRYRMSAEMLRDVGLWTSGLLDPHMGGEGVKPVQPEGMWKALAHPASNTKQYKADEGEKVYRRSLYVYWKRTSPHPMMSLFDAPSREVSCVRRSRSNTPLQSLGLFNEPQRQEIARKLAARVLQERQDEAARMTRLFELVASRSPNGAERKAVTELLAQMRDRYGAAPADAVALVAAEGPGPAVIEHAAWTQVAATVLASDLALLVY